MATTSRLLCGIVLLALAACDQRVPTDPLAPAGPRRALDFDTAQLSRAGYELVTIFDVPVKRDDASVPWTSTGVTLGDGELAYVIPEGAVSFTLNDVGRAICAREYQWYCGKVSGTAGPYGGVGGPSGAYDAELRLFYRVDGSGSHAQILAFASLAQGPGTIEVSRAGARDPWDYSGAQTVQIWRKRGAQPPPPPQQEPKIALACTPNPVVRGQEITCTASKDSASPPGELKITGWSFGGIVRSDGDPTSTVWQGIVVQGGDVQVRGTVGGQIASGGLASITVVGRDWSERYVPFITEQTLSALPERPTKSEDLGSFYPVVTVSDLALAIPIIDHGPNKGYAYVLANPFSVVGRVQVNTAALQVGSAFWNRQADARYTNMYGVIMCGRADVAPFAPIVLAHEGIPINPASHAGLFEAEIRKEGSKYLEALTGFGDTETEPDDEVRSRVFSQAEAEFTVRYKRALIADDKADRPPLAPAYCTFRYFR